MRVPDGVPEGFVPCPSCPPGDVCQWCRPRLDRYLALLRETYPVVDA